MHTKQRLTGDYTDNANTSFCRLKSNLLIIVDLQNEKVLECLIVNTYTKCLLQKL